MAKFGYEITSKDRTKKGVADAKQGLQTLTGATQKASRAMKAALGAIGITATFAALTKGISTSIRLFGEQEKVELRLAAAARNNPLINGDAVKSLKATASAMQQLTIFGDEALIQQQSFLTTLQFSETEINKILSAAVDLASTGMVSLDSAVRNIAKTYAGMSGELGELIPQLRELSAEELKAGEGVDLIAQQFAGMAQAAAQGVSGAIEQTKNLVGDMAESIGGALAPIAKNILQGIQPAVQGLTQWITDHQQQISNFFLNLPDIARLSFETLRKIVTRIMTAEYLLHAVSSVWTWFKAQMQSALTLFIQAIKTIGVLVWEPLKVGLEWAAYGIKVAWRSTIDFLIELINTLLTPVNAMIGGLEKIVDSARTAGAAVQAFIKHPFNARKREQAFAQITQGQEAAEFGRMGIAARERAQLQRPGAVDTDKMLKSVNTLLTAVPQYLKETFQNLTALGADIAEPMGDLFKDFEGRFKLILNRELDIGLRSPVEALTNSLDATRETWREGYAQGTAGIPGVRPTSAVPDVAAGAAAAAGPLGALAMAANEFLSQIESINILMNAGKFIMDNILKILGPAIDKILAPLVGILATMGQMIGHVLIPIFQALSPIITAVTKAFVWFYNKALRHVGNAIIAVGNILYNAVATVANGFIFIYNLLVGKKKEKPYLQKRDIRSGFLGELTVEGVTATGGEAIAGGVGQTGAAAQYTAGRTINMQVNIYSDVITGDPDGLRALAMIIRDEIREAEAMGL